MKKVLSLLMPFVFLQTQTWALSGGPDYLNKSNFPNSLIGTYGGVLVSKSTTLPAAAPNQSAAPSMGIFSVAITQTNLATGSFVVFVRGTVYIGNIIASADADKKNIDGLLTGRATYQVVITELESTETETADDGTVTVTENYVRNTYPVLCEGTIQAKVKEGDAGAFNVAPAGSGAGTGGGGGGSSSTTFPTTLEVGSTNAARLTGTAIIDSFFNINSDGTPNVNETNTFTIDGFKQSNIPTTATDVASSFNTGG